MKSKTAIWFECKVKYEKLQEDGLQKKVTETYVVNALSFADAEMRITEELAQYISGEFTIEDVKKAPYKEIFFADEDAMADRWYKARLDFITINEKTEKEKRTRVNYLVQAGTLKKAIVGIEDVMSGTMIDYEACAVDATKIEDVFVIDKSEEHE